MTDQKNIHSTSDNQPIHNCSRCGSIITPSDPYCKKCGTPTPFKADLDAKGVSASHESESISLLSRRSIRKTPPRSLRNRNGQERPVSAPRAGLSDTQRLRFNFEEVDYVPQADEAVETRQSDSKSQPQRRTIHEKQSRRRPKRDVPIFWGVRIFVFLILSLMIAGGYGIVRIVQYAQANADNAVEAVQTFEGAIEDSSGETLAQVLSSDTTLISASELAPFVKKLGSDTVYRDSLVQTLRRNAEALDAGQVPAQVGEIQIIPQGESQFGVQQYGLIITKMKLNFSLPEGMDLSIDGKPINRTGQTGEHEIYPGLYQLGLTYDDLTLHYALDISSANPQAQDKVITFNFENTRLQDALPDFELTSGDRQLEIRTLGHSDALVFVNNQNTGLTVDAFNGLGSSSIETGDDIRIIIKEDWGFVASPNHVLGPERWVRLHINYDNPN